MSLCWWVEAHWLLRLQKRKTFPWLSGLLFVFPPLNSHDWGCLFSFFVCSPVLCVFVYACVRMCKGAWVCARACEGQSSTSASFLCHRAHWLLGQMSLISLELTEVAAAACPASHRDPAFPLLVCGEASAGPHTCKVRAVVTRCHHSLAVKFLVQLLVIIPLFTPPSSMWGSPSHL